MKELNSISSTILAVLTAVFIPLTVSAENSCSGLFLAREIIVRPTTPSAVFDRLRGNTGESLRTELQALEREEVVELSKRVVNLSKLDAPTADEMRDLSVFLQSLAELTKSRPQFREVIQHRLLDAVEAVTANKSSAYNKVEPLGLLLAIASGMHDISYLKKIAAKMTASTIDFNGHPVSALATAVAWNGVSEILIDTAVTLKVSPAISASQNSITEIFDLHLKRRSNTTGSPARFLEPFTTMIGIAKTLLGSANRAVGFHIIKQLKFWYSHMTPAEQQIVKVNLKENLLYLFEDYPTLQ